jgi:hypothetical protein
MQDKQPTCILSEEEVYAEALRPIKKGKEIDPAQVRLYSEALDLLDRGETVEERLSRHYQRLLDEPVAASSPSESFGLSPKI